MFQLLPREVVPTLAIPNQESKAVSQRPLESLFAIKNVEIGVSILAVEMYSFDDGVLDHSDEARQTHGIEAVAGETEAQADIGLGVGDGEAVGERCGQSQGVRDV